MSTLSRTKDERSAHGEGENLLSNDLQLEEVVGFYEKRCGVERLTGVGAVLTSRALYKVASFVPGREGVLNRKNNPVSSTVQMKVI